MISQFNCTLHFGASNMLLTQLFFRHFLSDAKIL